MDLRTCLGLNQNSSLFVFLRRPEAATAPEQLSGPGTAVQPPEVPGKRALDLAGVLAPPSVFDNLENVGAGSASKTERVLTVLSAGVLGSYALTRQGTLRRQIDELVRARTGLRVDTTLKLGNLVASSSSKLETLTARTEVCQEILAALAEHARVNEASLKLYESMLNARNVSITSTARERVSNAWERTKDFVRRNHRPIVGRGRSASAGMPGSAPRSGVIRETAKITGMAAAVIALGSIAVTQPWLALPVIGGAGYTGKRMHRFYQSRFGSAARLRSSLRRLQEVQAAVRNIQQMTLAERNKLVGEVTKNYSPEVTMEKTTRDLLQLRCPDQLPHFEKALRDSVNPQTALEQWIVRLENLTNTQRGRLFTPEEIALLRRKAYTLTSRRAQNMRHHVNILLGNKEGKGVEGIAKLMQNMYQVHRLTGIMGRQLEIDAEPCSVVDVQVVQNHTLKMRLKDNQGEVRTLVLKVSAHKPPEVHQQVLQPALKERRSQLRAVKGSSSLQFEPQVDDVQKAQVRKLIAEGTKGPLSVEQYLMISKSLTLVVLPAFLTKDGGKARRTGRELWETNALGKDSVLKVADPVPQPAPLTVLQDFALAA